MVAFAKALKTLILLGIIGVSALFTYKNVQVNSGVVFAATQETECGAVGNSCVVNGRQYNLLVPEGEGPFPVLLFFHGSHGTGGKIISMDHVVSPALERGYAVIAPTALEIEYSDSAPGTGWLWQGKAGTRDDFRFVRNVVSDAETRFPIDTSRILTAGHSNGATFVWYLSCSAKDLRLRAFAPINGTLHKGIYAPCDQLRPRYSLMHSHGKSDTHMPVTGRPDNPAAHSKLGAMDSVERLTEAAKCQDVETTIVGRIETTQWSRCLTRDQLGVALFNGGHVIPKGWTDFILDWFEALPSQQ